MAGTHKYAEAICTHCDPVRPFWFEDRPGKPPPSSCGRIPCRARATYTDPEWEGMARMATVRRDAGVPLSKLDMEAIHRTGADL